jgi:CHAT domain-containing protein
MWELFERRLAAEGLFGAEIRSLNIIDRFAGEPAVASGPEFQRTLSTMPPYDLRVLCNRLLIMTDGRENGPGERGEPRSPRERRLDELRQITSAVMAQRKTEEDELTATDLAAAKACEPVNSRVEEVLSRVLRDGASSADLAPLAAAVRDYRAIIAAAALSAAGQRLVGFRLAHALDGLGDAAASQHDYAAAEVHYDAAREAYAQIGEERFAAGCAGKRDAQAQRQVPDADRTLGQLLASLDTMSQRSVEQAQVLVSLGELAHGNGDDFEAGLRLDEAVAVLAELGFDVPGRAGVDRAFESWIDAIAPGGSGVENHFLWSVTAMLSLQLRVAALRFLLTPSLASVQADAMRLSQIMTELMDRVQAVQARLQARLEQSSPGGLDEASLGYPPLSMPDLASDEDVAIGESINDLLDTVTSRPPDAGVLPQWRQEAAGYVQRARAAGDPLTLVQALQTAAFIADAAGDIPAVVPLLEEAYGHAAGVAGRRAAVLAIDAASKLAMAQLVLGELAQASQAAGQAIEFLERDRYRVNAPFQQAAYLAPHVDLFSVGVLAAFKQGDYDTMLQRMELSKARASVRQLFSPPGTVRADAPAGPAGRDVARLERELSTVTAAIHSAASAADAHRLRARRLELWDLRSVARRDPAATTPAVTVARIQSLLEPTEAVVYYYWLNRAALLIVTITSTGIAVDMRPFTPHERGKLDGLVDELSALSGSNLGLDLAFIVPLAQLLAPAGGERLLDGKDRLLISPHRLLHWYPFAAMPYRGRPLVRTFALRQTPNLTSLLVPRTAAAKKSIAGIAVSSFPGRPSLDPLPQVQQEVTEVAAIYDAAGVAVKLMREPRRADVLGALGDGTLNAAWCLHLATHGHPIADEISKDAPLETMLELADGSVDGYEIAGADLGCEVVVLTACDSGQFAVRGRGMAEQPGDELFGMPAAFLEAGCGSVLAPTWPADENTTSWIIADFHRHIAHGFPADVALAQAQRAFLDTADAIGRRAYFWAPLTLTAIGRPMPRAGTSVRGGQ